MNTDPVNRMKHPIYLWHITPFQKSYSLLKKQFILFKLKPNEKVPKPQEAHREKAKEYFVHCSEIRPQKRK